MCPTVSADLAFGVFRDLCKVIGFESPQRLNECCSITPGLVKHSLCESKPFDYLVAQQIVIRNYGVTSTKYVSLQLTWLPPSLTFDSNWRLSKNRRMVKLQQALYILEEEIKGRWRAILYQREYALESSKLDIVTDLWESLDPDQVDYVDSDDEDEPNNLPPPPEKPKSALKFGAATRRMSVTFSSQQVTHHLDLSVVSREARMSSGCRATDSNGLVKPLTSIATGHPVYLKHRDEEKPVTHRKKRKYNRHFSSSVDPYDCNQMLLSLPSDPSMVKTPLIA